MKRNGTRRVQIRSMQGKFEFRVQQFYDLLACEYKNWLQLKNYCSLHDYISEGLKAYSAWLSLGSSYEHSSRILERQLGEKILSDQSIYHIVESKATAVSQASKSAVLRVLADSDMPTISEDVDLYSADSEEVLLFEDGIQVKGQKQERLSKNKAQVSENGKGKRHNTDIVSLRQKDGSFSNFTNDLEGALDLSVYIKANITSSYEGQGVLNIVSIIDGASTIRKHLHTALEGKVIYILDWFHLRKKCNELLSMIAFGKQHREQLAKELLSLCWKGQVKQAIEQLKDLKKVRNQTKYQELINYLTKHQAAIIHYEKRQQIGKVIGSGHMESIVNEVIGTRQKDNGMAWSQKGSKALAILKIEVLNHNWDNIWNKAA